MKKKSRKRILGVDRALMMLCHQAKRYWRYYSPVYKQVKALKSCHVCADGKTCNVEVDHFPRLGPRPRTIEEFPDWWNRLMFGPQQALCHKHHRKKTKEEQENSNDEV